MPAVIRVTGAWVQLLTDWLDAEHLTAPEIRAALARHAPDDIVPVAEWRGLLERAVALRPEQEAPGLAIGAGVQPRHVGVLGYLVLASNTVGEAMLAYQRYERLFYGVDLAQVVLLGDEVELRWPSDTAQLGQTGDSVAIAALVTFMRRQTDNPPAPLHVGFVNPAPADAARYPDFFQCPVTFEDACTRVRFPVAYLAMPMPHRDPGLRVLLDRQAQALLAALPASDAFDRALQQVMLRQFGTGQVSLARVAKALHMSERTLQRRLDTRGHVWQTLLDSTREHLARQYLGDRALSLGDIALLLGYSEQSAFNRAFRRWTGETPARWRRAAG